MPLVPAICTQCGAKLEIESSQEATVCPYCCTPFITEKAINNYNNMNVTNIENLHADVVHISDDQSRDNRVKSGETFVKMNDYISAQKVFDKLTEECPYDYRGWWGLITVCSKNFTDMDISRVELLNIETLFNKVCTVASVEEKDRIEDIYKEYHGVVKDNLDTIINNTNKKIQVMKEEYASQKSDLERQINELVAQENRRKNPSIIICNVLVLIVLVLSVIFGIIYGVEMFFGALFTFGLLAAVIGYALFIIVGAFDKRVKDLEMKISPLRVKLDELNQEYKYQITELNKILRRVQ